MFKKKKGDEGAAADADPAIEARKAGSCWMSVFSSPSPSSLFTDDDDEASIALAIKLAQEEEDLGKAEKGKGDGGAALYKALQAEAHKPRSEEKTGQSIDCLDVLAAHHHIGELSAVPKVAIEVPGTATAKVSVAGQAQVRMATTPPTNHDVHHVLNSLQAVRKTRLMKELDRILKSDSVVKDGVFTVELVDDNLCEWDVHIKAFDADSLLARDLATIKRAHGIDDVWLRLSFPGSSVVF